MANWYMKGQSDYLVGGFHMGFYIDHSGFAEGDYGTQDMETHGATSDPFMAFGIDTGPATWTYGQQQVEIGLLKSHRLKFDTTGSYKWVGPGQDDWAIIETAGSAGNLGDLDDVVIDGTPANNELLAWDTTTSKWINQTDSEAGLALASALHTEDHDNTHHTTNYHTETAGTGVVTVHSDITSAGSGIIITTLERDALHTIVVAGDLNHNDLANIDADDIKHITATQLGNLHAIYTLEQHDNSFHSTNYHTESDGTGVVTVHSDVTSVGSGAIITTGERNALHAAVTQVYNLKALDDRDFKPNTSNSYGFVKAYFTSLGGMTGVADSDYQDLLILNTYMDATGGDINALTFDKSEMLIKHWFADQAAATWGTPKTIAYTDALHTEDHDNTHHTTNYHTETAGTGVVTVHSDITSAGSGIIITAGERGQLHDDVVTTVAHVEAVSINNLSEDASPSLGGNLTLAGGSRIIGPSVSDYYIWSISSAYLTYGLYYNTGTPDYLEIKWAGATTFAVDMETGNITTVGTVDGVDVSVFNSAMREQSTVFPAAPSEGDFHYDEDDDSLYRYNAEALAWVEVGVGGMTTAMPDASAFSGIKTLNTTERSSGETSSYTKLKEMMIQVTGTFTFHWQMKRPSGSVYAKSRIYVNGIAVGAEKQTDSGTYVDFSDSIAVDAGDLVQVYGKGSSTPGYLTNCSVQKFYVEKLGNINWDY